MEIPKYGYELKMDILKYGYELKIGDYLKRRGHIYIKRHTHFYLITDIKINNTELLVELEEQSIITIGRNEIVEVANHFK